MVDVVSDICGAHAQVAASAELMIGLRVAATTRQDVRAALWRDRTLVKTVGVRGTLHLLPAHEVPDWMAAKRLLLPEEERRLTRSGVTSSELDSLVRAIAEIVGPDPITRPDLEQQIEERVGGWSMATNQGWMGTHKNWPMGLAWAAAMGLVCYGPGEGGTTFVNLRDWAGWRDVDPKEGGRFVLRKFLQTYGPSTVAEFTRWFAASAAVANRIFASSMGELVQVAVEGEPRWSVAGDVVSAGEKPDGVRLLPHFDAFVVGSHPRAQLIEPSSPIVAVSPGTAAPFAVVLRRGRVAGVWHRKPKGKRLVVRVDAWWDLSHKDRAAIEEQAVRVAQVLERECELELGPVELRPHA